MPSFQYKVFSRFIGLIPLKQRLQVLYFRRFRRFCDFENPVRFTEKIQCLKLFERDPILTISADKIASKEFVREICPDIYIPKTIWQASSHIDIDELDFGCLPDEYVFKANHTSQTIEIIRDGNHLSRELMKKLSKSWLAHDQSASLGEWAYENIPRNVFIEEFLDFNNTVPDDYKFFVYQGKVKFIQLDSDRFISHKRNMFDQYWRELDFEYSHSRKSPPPKKPIFLDEMILAAEKIGHHLKFVRVDFYFYKDQITFGELTIYPGAGFEKFPEDKWDVFFGKDLYLK
ncbi:ATP-grasp fold amidoligase family protein [Enterovibrio norvegicus]|uniref:ATP-grasp fold amidoligase family protein n=1 Tax=Enterovibrio norvegicus TaxID=188144 RepID=UPI0013CF8CC3|nr:ATP-grasp fold amidoligase family protein [Enterovibrio norvegicus]